MSFRADSRIENAASPSRYRSIGTPMYALWGILAFLTGLTLVGPVQDVRSFLSLGYLLQITIYTALNLSRHNYALIRLLQPSMISLIYIGLWSAIGAWAFSSGSIVNMLGASSYIYWPNLKQTYILVSLCFLILYLLSLRDLDLPRSDIPHDGPSNEYPPVIAPIIVFLFAGLFFSTKLELSVLSQLKTIIAAAIFYIIFRYDLNYKLIIVIVIFGILATTSAHSKREAIFSIPAMLLITLAYYPNTKITIQKAIMAVAAIVSIVVLILAMSILRGYGSFNVNNVVEAVKFIPQYLDMQNSLGLVLNNFEVSYIFLHMHNCISAVLETPAEMAHGETYIRTLLIWPIGDAIGYKPASIIEQYTGTFFPNFRDVGGSFGVTSIGEAAWNFGWLAPLALFSVYLGLDSLFAWLVRLIRSRSAWGTIFGINVFQFILYYARGSGLDILLIYVSFSAVVGALIAVFFKMFHIDSRRLRLHRANGSVASGTKFGVSPVA